MKYTSFYRAPGNYDPDEVSNDTALSYFGESMTKQEFREECDINTIVTRFGLTGEMPDAPNLPQYGDFTDVTDYQSALNAVRVAEEGFMELPPEVRYRFANDPQRLMEFLANNANRDEAIKLGLVKAPVVSERVDAPVDAAAK